MLVLTRSSAKNAPLHAAHSLSFMQIANSEIEQPHVFKT